MQAQHRIELNLRDKEEAGAGGGLPVTVAPAQEPAMSAGSPGC